MVFLRYEKIVYLNHAFNKKYIIIITLIFLRAIEK